MTAYFPTRITLVWALLVGATMLSWELGHNVGLSDPRIIGISIILVAFIKVRFVFFEFMEVRCAPSILKKLVDGWIVLVCGVMFAVYWLGSRPQLEYWPDIPGL